MPLNEGGGFHPRNPNEGERLWRRVEMDAQ